MSTTYTIMIQNAHGQNGDYAIFNSPPAVTTDTGSPDVYTNIWASSFIPNGGNTTLSTTEDFYAWAGTTPATPTPGVTVQTGSSQVAQIGIHGNPGSTFPMTVTSGVPVLGAPTLTARQGAFEIDTDMSFVTPNSTYLVGLGKINPGLGAVGPVASILADNNSRITVQPIMKFFVATSSYRAGQIVNFATATMDAGVVDFSTGLGIGKNTAVITHDNTGAFTTRYLTQSQTVLALDAAKNKSLPSFLKQLAGNDKKFQLNQVIETLRTILSSFDDDTTSNSDLIPDSPLHWIGRVKWPAAVAFSVAAAGATAISTALVNKGYKLEVSSTSDAQKNTLWTWSITPPASNGASALGSVNVVADWNASVAADMQNDQHKNEGVNPATLSNARLNVHLNEQTPHGAGNHGSALNGGSDDANDNIGNHFSKLHLRAIDA
ncbi:hypothetical protein PFICI_02721 [Pestalotiopsis fici W106-1]|uniref:Uncharacterized protein n=1 Tax=Pestalotiopsis fici (strain W106-1 / CGMCC3.15140) TaxID=1229662 RepID=W3XHJ6_PESFW|nr:uncharacterized protein PFICI_02721 [Pestalotiopsis fici W106-1]ETS84696.1 hypothetical protein PFICI_02721 [Pestalotiopsis fici W106-1]